LDTDYLSPRARRLSPYVPGEQPSGRWVKLNTNESPFPPSPRVRAAIKAVLDGDFAGLRLYPDPRAEALREALARHHGVSPDCVFVSNGSDEALSFAFAAFFADRRCATPEIGYSFYPSYGLLFNAETVFTPVREDFTVDLDALADAKLPVILANPNAPTTLEVSRADLLALRESQEKHGCVLAVDEAYGLYGDSAVIDMACKTDNLLVIRTLSKAYGLAGMRVGYAVGSRPLIAGLERVRDSFNSYPLDRLAQAAALAAVEDDAYVRECVATVRATRSISRSVLQNMGFDVPESKTNFLFARHPGHGGAALFEGLKERRILVRHFNKPRLADWLRITVGSRDDMRAAEQALRELTA